MAGPGPETSAGPAHPVRAESTWPTGRWVWQRRCGPDRRGWGVGTAPQPLWAGFPTPAVISDLPTTGLPKPGGWVRAGVGTAPCPSGSPLCTPAPRPPASPLPAARSCFLFGCGSRLSFGPAVVFTTHAHPGYLLPFAFL